MNVKIGDKVRVKTKSCFNGYQGILMALNLTERFTITSYHGNRKVKGSAIIRGDTSTLVIPGLNNIKLIKI